MADSAAPSPAAGQVVPPRSLLRQFLPIVLALVVGTGVTDAVFFLFQGTDQARLRADFANTAADRAHAIRAALVEDFIELNLLGSYVSAARELAQGQLGAFAQEFGRFSGRIPRLEPDAQVLAFVPVVSFVQRSQFERLVQREFDPDYRLLEPLPEGGFRPVRPRLSYYPVMVVEPPEYTSVISGLDLAAVPELRAAIERAIAVGTIVASESTSLPQRTEERSTVWHFLPLYRSLGAPGEQRVRGDLIGLAASSFRIDQKVELALKDLSPVGIDFELLDPGAPASQQLLYYHHSRIPGYDARGVVKTGLTWSTRIDAGSRMWIFNAYPTSEFLARHRSWPSYSILAGGLLLTAAGGVFFSARLRRTRRVESLVAERTRALAAEISKHEALERALAESRASLSGQVERLHANNREVQLLIEVGDMLQSCLSMEEAYPVIAINGPQLLPGTSGGLYVHDAEKNLYGLASVWGGAPPSMTVFTAEDCWALRRGKVHMVNPASATLPCRHAPGDLGPGSLCIPLAATGKSIGLLHLTHCGEEARGFALSVADRVGQALSNLMLRSDLRQLSIHDPLTTLFNRRYMEETLEMELRRAERKEHPIGFIMVDIDHFKAFNDGFGHAAGDAVLQSLGTLIRTNLRGGDIACRYGGEEFLLILPGASAEAACARAEDLRERVKKMVVRSADTTLGPVSISLGVSIYPDNGRTRDELLAAADAGLYEAKKGGRDRVVLAPHG
jgi:diguanylate cyclase (GGDEF)-like protein